jgi:starvation-inducible outer membrane lipoprotein
MAHTNRLNSLIFISLLLTLMLSACVTPEPRLVEVSQLVTQKETVVETVYESAAETAPAFVLMPEE